jgi:putative membrane protein
MSSLSRFAAVCFGGLLVAGAAAAGEPPTQAPVTADVLGQLHSTNVKEYRMGKMALERGLAQHVRTFGQTLIDDHDDLDTKVVELAKEKDITLAAHTPAVEMEMLPTGGAFDTSFAKAMARDHAKAIKEVKAVRDSTHDEKLKALLTDEVLPVLQRHEATAQKIVDQSRKS